jgi:hypothetical protein
VIKKHKEMPHPREIRRAESSEGCTWHRHNEPDKYWCYSLKSLHKPYRTSKYDTEFLADLLCGVTGQHLDGFPLGSLLESLTQFESQRAMVYVIILPCHKNLSFFKYLM